MRSQLAELETKHDLIGEVRQEGLMCGVEIVHDQDEWTPARAPATDVINQLRHRGVLIGSTGSHENILKIRPPLIFEPQHVDILIDALDTTCTKVGDTVNE
jgi:4-aminobutyrate aminotransferase-like enzyme